MLDFLLMKLRGAFVIFTCIKEPASGKCFNARNYQEKSWNTLFSLATTWREEENEEGCCVFCAGIGNL